MAHSLIFEPSGVDVLQINLTKHSHGSVVHTIAITMMSQHQTNFHHQLPKSFKCYKKKGKKKFCKHSLVSKYECENVKEKETD